MNTVLTVCAIAFTLAIIVAVVFLVRTLLQVARTAHEAEILLKGINTEVSTLMKISDKISNLMEAFSSPWMKAGTLITSIISSMLTSKKRASRDSSCGSEDKDEATVGSL
jgi:hypothetical protein